MKITKKPYKVFLLFSCFLLFFVFLCVLFVGLFFHHYKNETTDIAKWSKKQLKHRLRREKKKDNIMKDIKKNFSIKKENKSIKDRIIKDIKLHFGQEDDYYKLVRVSDFWNGNYIKYENNSDKNKNLLVILYFNKLEPYRKDFTNNLQKSGTWKVQLTNAIKFISSKDDDEEQVMHSKIDSIE